MSYTIYVHAAHHGQNRALEKLLETCPALIGRGPTAALVLDGDPRVSNVHASLDVVAGRLRVRDLRSTNGVFVQGRKLEQDRWNELGLAEDEHEIRIGGWLIRLRCQPVTVSSAETFGDGAGTTNLEPIPFGAREQKVISAPTPMAACAERLRHPVQGAREAGTALEQAVSRELRAVGERERVALAGLLRDVYPELAAHAEIRALAPKALTNVTPESAALTSLQGLARWYVGGDRALENVDEILGFTRRFQEGIDALVVGVAQAVAGLDSSRHEMQIAETADDGYPRTASAFARALFDWRSGTGDGAAKVRRAFQDLSVHQIALLTAVSAGIRALLNELAPQTIEAERTAALQRGGFWTRLHARWTSSHEFVAAYRRRHDDLAAEESAHFALIFGPEFAAEYRALVRETLAMNPTAMGEAADGRGGTQVMAAKGSPRSSPGA